MSTLGEILKALYGAYRLARGDPGGMAWFDLSLRGYWRSFRAAAVVLPLFLLLQSVRYGVDHLTVSLWRYMAVELIAYVTGWVAFPVLMIDVSRRIERPQRYLGFIIAYNWAAVLQNALYLTVAMLSVSGLLTGGGGILVLFALVAIIIYSWFVAKTALQITAPAAAAVVAIDFFISFVINMYAEGLLN